MKVDVDEGLVEVCRGEPPALIPMAQWEKAQRLTGKHQQLLRDLYNTYFPLEARHYFADWLEAQPW